MKKGTLLKAKWDGAIHKIISIENDVVTYECQSYRNNHNDSSDKYIDGLFRDKMEVMEKEFTIVSL